MFAPIRNFAIIAHIDHGKTTLTDRLLRETNTVSERELSERLMDSNPIEQERGITIKLAPVTMRYTFEGVEYELNLIDTPGHVDFGYEVSRSLQACEGAVLLVDATQGVQAQTVANFFKASELGLTIIPVLNKIDLPGADVEGSMLECIETFGFLEKDFVQVSAKSGFGVPALLEKIITTIPAPAIDSAAPLQALVFSSYFDQHQGVVASVRVVAGSISVNRSAKAPLAEAITTIATASPLEPLSVGQYRPAPVACSALHAGQVGFIATGVKDPAIITTGDTITTLSKGKPAAPPLPGYHQPTSLVFQELYPISGDDFHELRVSVEKLKLHDASLNVKPVHSSALGNGLQIGFLGILHAEVAAERLRREFNLDLIATAPSVEYHVTTTAGESLIVTSASHLPDPSQIAEVREPIVIATLYCPDTYLGAVYELCQLHRGKLELSEVYGDRHKLTYRMPLSEIITTFHGKLQSATSGYASLEYRVEEYLPVEAVRVSVLVNKEEIGPLSFIAVSEKAESEGKAVVQKLKEVIDRQLFEIPIQAAIGGRIIARETVKAYRKDVTAKLYGGDRTRRMKLLQKQAKGKAKRKQFGSVELGSEAFLAVLQR